LEVAADLFLANGYDGTSCADIARLAHVSINTIYKHFGDKFDLFCRVLRVTSENAVPATPMLIEHEDLFDALTEIAHLVCDVIFGQPFTCLMRLAIAETPLRAAQAFADNALMRLRELVATLFGRLQSHGSMPAGDALASSRLFVDLILGVAPPLVYAGCTSARPSESDLSEKVGLFIRGRFAQPPP
jgi:TetR/AcrR family transcriptional repressor of mexJK operon